MQFKNHTHGIVVFMIVAVLTLTRVLFAQNPRPLPKSAELENGNELPVHTVNSLNKSNVEKSETDLPDIQFVKSSTDDAGIGGQSLKKSEAVNVYDFTTGSDKYYGGATGAKDLGDGNWGMIAGDSNQSGIVTNSDKDPIISDLNEAGYYNADTNCSGIVTNSDKDLIIENLNKATNVP